MPQMMFFGVSKRSSFDNYPQKKEYSFAKRQKWPHHKPGPVEIGQMGPPGPGPGPTKCLEHR